MKMRGTTASLARLQRTIIGCWPARIGGALGVLTMPLLDMRLEAAGEGVGNPNVTFLVGCGVTLRTKPKPTPCNSGGCAGRADKTLNEVLGVRDDGHAKLRSGMETTSTSTGVRGVRWGRSSNASFGTRGTHESAWFCGPSGRGDCCLGVPAPEALGVDRLGVPAPARPGSRPEEASCARDCFRFTTSTFTSISRPRMLGCNSATNLLWLAALPQTATPYTASCG
mmetsp:Transcript_87232/g.270958  ORF Transcript_87232/g.270958 Transcript_87232/m.270958 type:complete len:225 (+) Transcript_87232:202-876(+)